MKKFAVLILFLIFYAGYVLFTQFIFGDNNLVEIKGQVFKRNNFLQTDILKNKEIVNYALLSFILKGDRRLYILKLNINGIYQGFNAFGGVNKSLRDAGQVSVWIKKSTFKDVRPKVYKIFVDGRKVFETMNKPGNNASLVILISGIVVCFMTTYYTLKK